MTADEWKTLSNEEKIARVDELPEVVEPTIPVPTWTECGRSLAPQLGAALAVVLVVLPIFGLYRCKVAEMRARPDILEARGPITPTAASGMRPLRGNIYAGTRVYDASASYVGKILSVNATKPGRSFVFQYADGTLSTKDWDAALGFGWYVQ